MIAIKVCLLEMVGVRGFVESMQGRGGYWSVPQGASRQRAIGRVGVASALIPAIGSERGSVLK